MQELDPAKMREGHCFNFFALWQCSSSGDNKHSAMQQQCRRRNSQVKKASKYSEESKMNSNSKFKSQRGPYHIDEPIPNKTPVEFYIMAAHNEFRK
jgi:hypothetical protein